MSTVGYGHDGYVPKTVNGMVFTAVFAIPSIAIHLALISRVGDRIREGVLAWQNWLYPLKMGARMRVGTLLAAVSALLLFSNTFCITF